MPFGCVCNCTLETQKRMVSTAFTFPSLGWQRFYDEKAHMLPLPCDVPTISDADVERIAQRVAQLLGEKK